MVEGRDIGTVVAPDADLKVYLTASAAERARRRSAEDAADLAATAADLARRDRLDSTRAADPLAQADDAVVLDSTELGIDEVVARLVSAAAGTAQHDERPTRRPRTISRGDFDGSTSSPSDSTTTVDDGRAAPCRSSPSSAGPTSASPHWSTGSSAAARRSSRTCRA